MDYGKWIIEIFGERHTKETRGHDHEHATDLEPEQWCDSCFAYAQQDEIERLRKALWNVVHGWDVPVDENWKPVFRKVWEEAREALHQNGSE